MVEEVPVEIPFEEKKGSSKGTIKKKKSSSRGCIQFSIAMLLSFCESLFSIRFWRPLYILPQSIDLRVFWLGNCVF